MLVITEHYFFTIVEGYIFRPVTDHYQTTPPRRPIDMPAQQLNFTKAMENYLDVFPAMARTLFGRLDEAYAMEKKKVEGLRQTYRNQRDRARHNEQNLPEKTTEYMITAVTSTMLDIVRDKFKWSCLRLN